MRQSGNTTHEIAADWKEYGFTLDTNAVFERAIEQGVLSADINAGNYAGGFMYMGDKSGRHEFKNTITREYIRCNMPVVKG